MAYLVIYLFTGIALLVTVLGQHFLTKRPRPSDEIYSLLEQVRGKPSIGKQFLEKVIVPILAGVFVIGAWPVAMVIAVRHMLSESATEKTTMPTSLQITETDVREKLSISDVELRERVTDPLAAVPEVPFGFLNAKWASFRDSLQSDDEI